MMFQFNLGPVLSPMPIIPNIPIQQHQPTIIDCHKYQKGKCTQGSRCKFSHRGRPKGICTNPCTLCRRELERKKSKVIKPNPCEFPGLQFQPLNLPGLHIFSHPNSRPHEILMRNMLNHLSEPESSQPQTSEENLGQAYPEDWIDDEALVSDIRLFDEYIHAQESRRRAKIDEMKKKSEREPEIVLEEESDPKKACSICMTYKKDHAFAPCGHKVLCGKCARDKEKLNGKCIVCRKEYQSIMTIYE